MDKAATPLRVLVVEDNSVDAELMLRELRLAGFNVDWQRVDTEAAFLERLQSGIDLVLSDYSMPQFSGMRALELLQERKLDIPFILISGTIGEDIAVLAIRSGAADYLLKDRLARLGQGVERVLEDKRIRQERKQTEETFDRLRRQHELILRSAGEGICGLDREGQIIFVNPKAANLLGWEADELLGKSFAETIHHTRSDGTKSSADTSLIHDCMRSGVTPRVTNDVFWRKDRKSFRVDYVCAPIKDEDGAITGSIITFKDITEQFAADARLKLQEQQYRLLFEINPHPMWVFDTKSLQILAVNEAAIAEYGYSRDEFLKLKLKDLRRADQFPNLIEARAASSPQQSSHFSGQFRHVRKNGSEILVEIYSSPTVWQGVAARIVTGIDVTERTRAEERLREQANIINRARDAIIIRNFSDRRIAFWNDGAERLYGWTSTEVVGHVGESLFVNPNDIETVMSALLARGEFQGEFKQLTKAGKELITKERATLVRNADGTPRSVLTLATDVTEQKKLEEQLLRAQRLESIGTLASGVAHDLNNVLTPILMCTEVLRGDLSTEDAESTISLIEASARRGAGIVKQVLTFARGIEGERVLISPTHLIEEMIDIARKTFPKSIEIDARYPENVWSIEADPTQLHQVLLNLSVNARDAMPNGGSLMIAAENSHLDEQYASITPGAKAGAYVMIRVRDTGTGMSRATIDKIFDPFFTTKDVSKGTGLGLSTSLGIVKSHGGFISVDSDEGKGTNFKVFLPANGTEEVLRPTKQAPVSTKGNGDLILVVDDEEGILQVTKVILESQGYRVLSASDGPTALALFSQQNGSVKAVLTDMVLPYMDGVAVVRELKKINPDAVVIASTGQGEHAHASEIEALGVANFLTKPYDTQKLLQTVGDALGKS